jgi:glutaredoxin
MRSTAVKTLAILTLIGLATMAHAAQVYEWVDEKGVKQYTQQPPPPNIKNVQQKRFGANVVETSGPTYSLQQAATNFPVTLYVTDCGDACTKARAHLAKRGIPYTEKNPQKEEEFENFKKLSGGGMGVPLLVIGELRTLKGYLESDWDAALDQARYPSASVRGAKPAAVAPPAGK